MAELSTVARPYAEAIISLATENSALDKWSENLDFLSITTQDDSVVKMVANPNVDTQTLTKILLDVCESQDDGVKNLVKTLIDNQRLDVLPHLAVEYEKLKAEKQNKLKVELVSGYEVTPEQQQELQTVLQKRFGKQIDINISIDAELIGGWVIRAGDEVIDASVKGRLQQLATELRQ
ncbi:F0F1 ATP synthase subunit delta [Candidatus Albibeggiatoa sp. nov. BB20]|uniref:F0F1 ATP synthase subunit delta n=1 Tax=Candidatus Albibeggiatoa sp. nov. BB20 TaxID=3162723 RepID=UPI0033652F9E